MAQHQVVGKLAGREHDVCQGRARFPVMRRPHIPAQDFARSGGARQLDPAGCEFGDPLRGIEQTPQRRSALVVPGPHQTLH